MDISTSYNLFLKFLETYTPVGFLGIDPNDQLLVELEEMMEANNQFYYVADLIKLKILYTSKRSFQMIGIEPEELTPYHIMEATHPDDLHRYNLAKAKLIRMAEKLYSAEKGFALISTNTRMRNTDGAYTSFLTQGYLFYAAIPYKTVYFLKIHSNIDWYKKIKHGYHYYIGNDFKYFKYPDHELLSLGNVFTGREFEIIKLIASGLSTEQIAEKLFLSPYTINTHRGNILKKTGKAHIFELIHELQERGIL
jgi:DNA-binding CsgD family transcriptional regulator